MRYSHGMTTEDIAPEIYPGYPYKRRLFAPWQEMWDSLREAGAEPLDGVALARAVAERHHVAPATLQGILSRGVRHGILVSELRDVDVEVLRMEDDGSERTVMSTRRRAHYWIAPDRAMAVKPGKPARCGPIAVLRKAVERNAQMHVEQQEPS